MPRLAAVRVSLLAQYSRRVSWSITMPKAVLSVVPAAVAPAEVRNSSLSLPSRLADQMPRLAGATAPVLAQ